MVSIRLKKCCLFTVLFTVMVSFLFLCGCNPKNQDIKPATLEDFKSACGKFGHDASLESIMSDNDVLIGYSLKEGYGDSASNLIFYDAKSDKNIDKLYSECSQSIKHLSSMNNISSNLHEDSAANYEYLKATDFKCDDDYKVELPLQLAYTIKVDTTCLYMTVYPNEYEDYVAIAKEIGYYL